MTEEIYIEREKLYELYGWNDIKKFNIMLLDAGWGSDQTYSLKELDMLIADLQKVREHLTTEGKE